MEESKDKLIGEIDFFGKKKVNVYYNPDTTGALVYCAWRMRNPDNCYRGIMYIDNVSGRISYPPDAVIPNQTTEDIEMLPIAIITNKKMIDEELEVSAISYFITEHRRRNRDLYGEKD